MRSIGPHYTSDITAAVHELRKWTDSPQVPQVPQFNNNNSRTSRKEMRNEGEKIERMLLLLFDGK